jgi:hypothetical protein
MVFHDFGNAGKGIVLQAPVSDKTLDFTDRNRLLIDKVPAAFFFAGSRADSPDRSREGDVLVQCFEGFFVFPLGCQVDVSLDVSMCRAG